MCRRIYQSKPRITYAYVFHWQPISKGLQPSRHQELSPLHFFLWEVLKDTVYSDQPQTMEKLRVITKRTVRHKKCDIGARPCNRCCCGQALSITYTECVFVALGIRHAMRMSYIVSGGLSGYATILNIMS